MHRYPLCLLPECNSRARVDSDSVFLKFRVAFLSVPFPSFATQSRHRFRATELPASVSDPEVPSVASPHVPLLRGATFSFRIKRHAPLPLPSPFNINIADLLTVPLLTADLYLCCFLSGTTCIMCLRRADLVTSNIPFSCYHRCIEERNVKTALVGLRLFVSHTVTRQRHGIV